MDIFLQLYRGKNKLNFEEMIMSALYNSDSEPFKSVFLLLISVYLAEKQDIVIYQSLVLLVRFSVPWSTALEAITVDLK